MTESNAVLQLKAKNDRLKAELREQKWLDNGRIKEALERKNLALDALHMVWCSGGCACLKEPVTAEMVSYVEEYAKRLRTWFVNSRGRESVPSRTVQELRWNSPEFDRFMDAHHRAWQEARDEIDAARSVLEDRYLYGDRVHLTGDVLACVKPWDTGTVMVHDGGTVLVHWQLAGFEEYHWVKENLLKRVDGFDTPEDIDE